MTAADAFLDNLFQKAEQSQGAVRGEQHRGHLRMAERVANEQGDVLRHVNGLGWHVWDACRWAEDEDDTSTRHVIATIKAALQDAVALPKDDREALLADIRKSESSAGLMGTVSLAGRLLPIAVSHRRLDMNGALFNMPGGTLDLESGEVRAHDRNDHITKVAGADPGEQGREIWTAFLGRVLPDEDVRAFVQRLIGYAMLGEVREHVMPIFTGTGRNGKGTFRDAVLAAFGDYAHESDPALLMESKHERHGTFKMQLRGRRLVFCSETEKGRRFAESTMKRLVGGDPIEANRMHKDPIVFQPSHTLVMLTNHLPDVSGDDPAVWERILVVPFDVFIPPEERDGRLPERLKAAAPAVLAWAVEGWQEYQRIGLAPPDAVRARTEQYRADSDTLGQFIEECCRLAPDKLSAARDMYAEFTRWVKANHSDRSSGPSEPAFAEAMKARGYEKVRRKTGRFYVGIELNEAVRSPT